MNQLSVRELFNAFSPHPDLLSAHRFDTITVASVHLAIGPARWLLDSRLSKLALVTLFARPVTVIDPSSTGPDTRVSSLVLTPGNKIKVAPSARTHAVACWLPAAAVPVQRGPMKIKSESTLIQAFRVFMSAVISQVSPHPPTAVHTIEHIVLEMVSTLTRDLSEQPLSESPIEAARRMIQSRKTDPEFSVEDVASALKISVRHLQRIFAEHGTSPAAELRTARVQLAHEMLLDPVYSQFTREQIARRSGFSGTQQMRSATARTFQRRATADRQAG